MTAADKEIQADYKNRINRVFEFIDQNFESDLSLNAVSQTAFFSPFHFHRIFKFATEETLHEYVKRRRIEKSASDLMHKNIAAAELAHKYGFSDNSPIPEHLKSILE
ncbi:helix-turn-helix domain-containing protein [Flavobacterium sp. HJSW_4]|uniref:helix-turn-helix domain-containing protein n=1 Tax=Flavobacterium sp. HJSW_4 TaxID=3344660 RepID=UPI0035F4DDBC